MGAMMESCVPGLLNMTYHDSYGSKKGGQVAQREGGWPHKCEQPTQEHRCMAFIVNL